MGRIKLHFDDDVMQYSQIIDDSGIIDYDCDTLYIRDNKWTHISSNYQFKCNKGLYDLTDKGLTPCDYSYLYSSEVLFAILYKGNPDAEREERKRYD